MLFRSHKPHPRSWCVLSATLRVSSFLTPAVVVENFSFVFQVYGRVKMLDREQLRSFKKVWAAFDTERSGYLPRRDIVRFLGVRLLIWSPRHRD